MFYYTRLGRGFFPRGHVVARSHLCGGRPPATPPLEATPTHGWRDRLEWVPSFPRTPACPFRKRVFPDARDVRLSGAPRLQALSSSTGNHALATGLVLRFSLVIHFWRVDLLSNCLAR
jgi:hypothetical protein